MSLPRTFDERYFKKYAGSGTSYNRVFRAYSSIENCLTLFLMKSAPKIRRIAVYGTATGRVQELIEEKLGIRASGCEISEWAFDQLPAKYRSKVKLMDMREYVKVSPRVDLVFTNSLMYLPEKDILPLLKRLARKTRFVHFEGSFLGAACPDPYRQTLKTRMWWRKQFSKAGFEELRTVWGQHTHLWLCRKEYTERFIKN